MNFLKLGMKNKVLVKLGSKIVFYPIFYLCCAHLEYEYHLLFQNIEEKEYVVYYGFVYWIILFTGFLFEQLSVCSFGRYEHKFLSFFSTFSINISSCLIHCSIKQFLLMSLLLWISVLSVRLSHWQLGEGLILWVF